MSSQISVQDLLSLFSVTFTSHDSKQIQQAEKSLKQLSEDIPSFSNLLLSALSLKDLHLNLQKSLCVYFRNLISINITKVPKEQAIVLISKVLDLLFSIDFPYPVFCLLVSAMDKILAVYDFTIDLAQRYNELLAIHFNDVAKVKTILKLSTHLCNYNLPNMYNIQRIAEEVIKEAEFVISAFKGKVYSDDIIEIFSTLYELLYLILIHLKKYSYINESNAMIIFNKFYDVTMEIITSHNKDNVIVYIGKSKTENSINGLKACCFLFLLTLVDIVNKENKKNDAISVFAIQMINMIIDAINNMITNHYSILDCIEENTNEINKLLMYMIQFFSLSLNNDKVRLNFAPTINSILINTLIPLLQDSTAEINKIKIEGSDHCIFINDLLSSSKSKNYKTMTIILIKLLLTLYEPLCNYFLSFLIQVIQFELSIHKDIEDCSLLSSNQSSIILNRKVISSDKSLSISFLLLSIFHKQLIHNNLLFGKFTDIITTYIDMLHSIDIIFIKEKLILLYKVFTEEFIKKDIASHIICKIYHFLFSLLLQFEQYPCLAELSSEPLLLMLKMQGSVITIIHDIMNNKIDKICDIIKNSNIIMIFNVLSEVFRTIRIDSKIKQKIYLVTLTERIIKEVDARNDTFVTNGVQLLLALLDQVNKISDPLSLSEVEEVLSHFALSLSKNNTVLFSDDILRIVIKVNELYQSPSQLSILILPYIPQCIKEEGEVSELVYQYFISIIKYSNETFFLSLLSNIIEILLPCLDYKDEYSITFTTSLLSIILVSSQNISVNTLSMILNRLMICIGKKKEEEDDENTDILNLKVISTICASMIYYLKSTIEIVSEKKILDMMNILYNIEGDVNYDSQVGRYIIFGVFNLIQQLTDFNLIIDLLKLEQMYLLKQKDFDIFRLNKLTDKEPQINYIDESSDEDEEDEHLKEEETKIEKYNNEYLLLNEVSSSEWVRINEKDEFALFSHYFKERNDIKEMYISSLKPKDKNEFSELIQLHRVKVKVKNKELLIPRKILRIVNKY